jgi:hypothetical protein
MTPAQRRHWRRALTIASIVFEQEGYHSRYLWEIAQYLATQPVTEGTPRRQDPGQYCARCAAWRPETPAGTCHHCGTELVPF